MSNYVNFHVLISHSPSCLNRDDMNMQKTAVFGGVRRVRISSQSLKRSMRWSDYYTVNLGTPAVRTRELGQLKAKFALALKDRYDGALVHKAIEWISGKEGLTEKTQADAVAPWAVDEVARVCEWIREQPDIDTDKLQKQIEKNSAPIREALANTLDIALSGRMATSGLMTSVDGALAVAHAITTHAVDGDIDWFTAVDDLISDAGDVGAGHLNTQEFSSGVFYRYASLNLKQLQVNLGLLPNMKAEETAESRARALDIAAHVLHLLATVVPSAKQQSFAAHNLADYAMVSFADQPISLANAFEKAVTSNRDSGYLEPSIDALCGYWHRVHSAYGLPERAAAFSVAKGCEGGSIKPFGNLDELKQWIRRSGE